MCVLLLALDTSLFDQTVQMANGDPQDPCGLRGGHQIIQFDVSFIVVTRVSNVADNGEGGEAMFIRRIIDDHLHLCETRLCHNYKKCPPPRSLSDIRKHENFGTHIWLRINDLDSATVI